MIPEWRGARPADHDEEPNREKGDAEDQGGADLATGCEMRRHRPSSGTSERSIAERQEQPPRGGLPGLREGPGSDLLNDDITGRRQKRSHKESRDDRKQSSSHRLPGGDEEGPFQP